MEIRRLMWLMSIVLFVLGISSQQVEAAGVQYVNAKGDIFLRDAASADANKIATIKNYTAVSVISTSKGWSYIQFGKQKGYVYASALSKKHPKEDQSITSGFSPKAGLTLTYSPSFHGDGSTAYQVQPFRENVKKLAQTQDLDREDYIFYKESKEALFVGLNDTDWVVAYMDYPIKKGKAYKTFQEGGEIHYRVESTTATIKVKAGTFHNVIIIRSGSIRYYFAKNIGLIKMTFDGEVYVELATVT